MSVQLANIQHDGGTYDVSVEIEYGQCVIKFGGSFTLRVDEDNLDKLRNMIHIASRDLMGLPYPGYGTCKFKEPVV